MQAVCLKLNLDHVIVFSWCRLLLHVPPEASAQLSEPSDWISIHEGMEDCWIRVVVFVKGGNNIDYSRKPSSELIVSTREPSCGNA